MRIASRQATLPDIPLTFLMGGLGLGIVAFTIIASRQSIGLAIHSGLLSPTLILAVLPFAIGSYLLRILRWHFLVQRLEPRLPISLSGYSQIVGFALSATPGRIAELYKLKLLEQSAALPVTRSFPAVVVERLTDVLAFGIFVMAGSIFALSGSSLNGHPIVLIAGVGFALLIGMFPASRRRQVRALFASPRVKSFTQQALDLARAIPGGRRSVSILSQLRSGGELVSQPRVVVLALLCVTLGRIGDSVVLWKIAGGAGISIALPFAIFMIGSSGLIGGFSLSPGGLGTADATLIGLLMSQGAPFATALVAALATRAVIFWLWVSLGILVLFTSHGVHSLIGVTEETASNSAARLTLGARQVASDDAPRSKVVVQNRGE